MQAACNKTEAVIADSPGLSLDDLIAKKKINADQKAQIQKKPVLQAELARLEDQVAHYRKFGKDYEDRYAKEKAVLEASHSEALAKVRQEAVDEAAVTVKDKADEHLLVLTQFLHAAAAKRDDAEVDPVEKAAFEGVLLQVYQGNSAAFKAFRNIAAGSADKVLSMTGEELDFTYEQIKQISVTSAPALDGEEADNEASEANEAHPTETDPTIAHAGLTELEDTVPQRAVADREDTLATPVQSSIAPEAANSAAGRKWDPQSSMVSDTPSGEWVEVPRDPTETDTGVSATPAAIHNSTSWAEEVNADAVAAEKPDNDGFEQVVHRGARGRPSRAEFRGRGRGEYRGRGRGDGDRRGGRGRGRGGDGRRGDWDGHNARGDRGRRGDWGGYNTRGDGGQRGDRDNTRGGEGKGEGWSAPVTNQPSLGNDW